MADDVAGAGLKQVSFTVRPESFTAPTVLSPATPVFVDEGVRVTTVGRDGYFASLERDGNGPYTVTALVPDPDSPDGPTDASLRGAGTDYPADVIALYTAEVPGIFGPNLRALRDEVVRTSSSPAPYDVAQRLVEVLHSDTFHYDTDVRNVECGTMSTPECFAASKRGYCMHYATTMAVILRDLGIPARVVAGFLPGIALRARQRRSLATVVRTPGSRSTSRATSGSRSIRLGEASRADAPSSSADTDQPPPDRTWAGRAGAVLQPD